MSRRVLLLLGGGGLLLAILFWMTGPGLWTNSSAVGAVKVYAYPSFVSALGAGPELKAAFEQAHPQCQIELHNAGDPGLLVNRIQLAAKDGADVALGFDQFQVLDEGFDVPCEFLSDDESRDVVEWRAEVKPYRSGCFYPFNWSPMTLITRDRRWDSIKNFQDLKQSDLAGTITVQDPRSSTPGMQFLFWLTREFNEDNDIGKTPPAKLAEGLRWLAPLIHSLHSNWSQSYGVFQKGLAPTTFTFLTSLIYEWEQDPKTDIHPVVFKSGHPVQVEYTGVLSSCRQCGCAKEFVRYMLSRDGQSILMKKNYMLPVIRGIEDVPLFKDLPDLPLLSFDDQKKFIAHKREWLEVWKKFSESL